MSVPSLSSKQIEELHPYAKYEMLNNLSLDNKQINETIMEEYVKTTARARLEVMCDCPCCGAFEDVIDYVQEHFKDELNVQGIDQEVTCSECNKIFIVENVYY